MYKIIKNNEMYIFYNVHSENNVQNPLTLEISIYLEVKPKSTKKLR